MNAHSDSKAPRVFPGILFLLAIPLLLGGLQLVLLGGSLYYLIAGFFLISCAAASCGRQEINSTKFSFLSCGRARSFLPSSPS